MIDRADVVAAYVHPRPEVAAHIAPNVSPLAKAALLAGYDVRTVEWRGTAAPSWKVSLPASGGPPVAFDQYGGEIMDGRTVYGRHETLGRFRCSWAGGRFAHALLASPRANWAGVGVTALTALVKSGGILYPPAPLARKATT